MYVLIVSIILWVLKTNNVQYVENLNGIKNYQLNRNNKLLINLYKMLLNSEY